MLDIICSYITVLYTVAYNQYKEAKRVLLGERVLAHYEEGLPLVLAVDSSAYG